MRKKAALYNELKAAQIASILLGLEGGTMNLLKLIKIMYALEKESLKRRGSLVTYDHFYSLPHGQVVSQTYDRAEYRDRPAHTIWSKYFKTTVRGREKFVHRVEDAGLSQLSRAEIELAKDIYDQNKNKTPAKLMEEHHTPSITPEWKDPGSGRIETKYASLLRILGKTDEQITEFENDLDELICLKSLR